MAVNRTATQRWKTLRARLIRERPKICYWCNTPLDPNAARGEPGAIELDHITPVKDAPERQWDPANLALSCADCNRKKGARTATAKVMHRSGAAAF